MAEALTKELAGFGPIEDLLADPAVEDILINGFDDVYVSRLGMLTKIPVRFADNAHPAAHRAPHPGTDRSAPG